MRGGGEIKFLMHHITDTNTHTLTHTYGMNQKEEGRYDTYTRTHTRTHTHTKKRKKKKIKDELYIKWGFYVAATYIHMYICVNSYLAIFF